MRRALPFLAAALLAAGCGDGEEPEAGATGASGAAGLAPLGLTAGEFLTELRPQKEEILSAYVAESDGCANAIVNPSFVLLVSAAAADAEPDAPLAPLVEEQCAGG